MNLAVIPARGGSKRIPRKNVRAFAGKPIIVWSIEAAFHSGVFDRVVVSTDDEEIADVGRAAGAEVPFTRPAELADDHTGTRAVMAHAVAALTVAEPSTTIVCCLYPTAPFVAADDLRSAVDLLRTDADTDVVMTVAAFASPIWRALVLDGDRLRRALPGYAGARSQDLPPAYFDVGQFYMARSEVWLDPGRRFVTGAVPIVVPAERAIDINTAADWAHAERTFRALGLAARRS